MDGKALKEPSSLPVGVMCWSLWIMEEEEPLSSVVYPLMNLPVVTQMTLVKLTDP